MQSQSVSQSVGRSVQSTCEEERGAGERTQKGGGAAIVGDLSSRTALHRVVDLWQRRSHTALQVGQCQVANERHGDACWDGGPADKEGAPCDHYQHDRWHHHVLVIPELDPQDER